MSATRASLGVKIGLAALAAAAGLAVSGCADLARVTSLAPEPVDASSPVAARVRAASRASYPRPRFRDVPPVPTDVRKPSAFKGAVVAAEQARDRLDNWVAANPPMVAAGDNETEAFAAGGRARIPADQVGAAPPDLAGSEDYAARLRALATPPPPPK